MTQVLALLRGKSEEQIQQQKEEITKYCIAKGFSPRFVEISEIMEVDLSSVSEKNIVFWDVSRISRDRFKCFQFIEECNKRDIKIYTAIDNNAVTLDMFQMLSNLIPKLIWKTQTP